MTIVIFMYQYVIARSVNIRLYHYDCIRSNPLDNN